VQTPLGSLIKVHKNDVRRGRLALRGSETSILIYEETAEGGGFMNFHSWVLAS